MSKELLTERLVTTPSFAPGENAAKRNASTPPPSKGIETLIQDEEAELRRQSLAEAWTEVRRRRGEILVDIDRAIQVLQKRKEETEEMQRTLSHRRTALADIEIDRPGPPPLGELRRMRQDLHDAHVELTVFQRIDEQGSQAEFAGIGEMSFREISRIGLALSWPLILGFLLAAGILVVGIRLALVL